MRRLANVVFLAAVLLGGVSTAEAATVTIKLATLVPDGSVWDKALKSMGSEWKSETAGRVNLRIYPGGVAGDEPDVLRKMRIGQLHAGSLTVRGLIDIDSSFEALAIPLFYDSYEEFYYVLHTIEPELRRRARAKGYELIQWGSVGWVHLFSSKPARTVEELKGLKLFVSAGDDQNVQFWKNEGFRPVALAMTDIMTGLQTGMIDILPTTPLAALSLQWFRQTPHMLDLGLAPLVGATVVSTRTWQRLSPEDRKTMLASALEIEKRLEREIPEQDRTAIEEMSKRGLKVESPADAEAWHKVAGEFAEAMRGERVPTEIYGQVLAARQAFRRSRAAEENR